MCIDWFDFSKVCLATYPVLHPTRKIQMNNARDIPSRDGKENLVFCPHCSGGIIIEKINCGIFRHAIFKVNGQLVPPHTPKHVLDEYIEKEMIYGCGKPFKYQRGDAVPVICDYI